MAIKMKKIKFKRKGFTLIETMLVLGVMGAIVAGIWAAVGRYNDNERARNSGEKLKEVGSALNLYVQNNRNDILSLIPVGTTIRTNVCVMTGSCTGVTLGPGQVIAGLPLNNILPRTFSDNSLLNTGYDITLKNFNNERVVGLVTTDAAVTLGSSNPRYDLLGTAMRAAGPSSGMSFRSGTAMTGLDGGWQLTRANSASDPDSLVWGNSAVAGLLGYRIGFDGDYDDIYLRRDGRYEMTGDLKLGNNNIKDINSITFDNYIAGQNAFFQNLRTQSIYNAGDIYTETINASKGQFGQLRTNNINSQADAGANNNVSFGRGTAGSNEDQLIAASGKLYARDIYLGAGQGRADGAYPNEERGVYGWLSDRLPRYSSRGVLMINTQSVFEGGAWVTKNFVTQPTNCGNGIPKIEVIPQVVYTQSRVLGQVELELKAGQIEMVKQDLKALGLAIAYADAGTLNGIPGWTVYMRTQDYLGETPNPAFPGMNSALRNGVVLAHVYCDFGNASTTNPGIIRQPPNVSTP